MELRPSVQVLGQSGPAGKNAPGIVRWLMVGVVVPGLAVDAIVVLLEIEELPPDHFCRQVEEVANRLQLDA